jgi:AraC-like DNA-binding protein
MPATDANPTKPSSDNVAGRCFWWPSTLPDVEVLERRDTPSFRGLLSQYAFAFQAGAVPIRVHYRGRLHDVPPGALMLCEPGETFEFADRSSVIVLFLSPNLISQVALEHFGYVRPLHWRTDVVSRSPLSDGLPATIGKLRNGSGHAAKAVASSFIASCITQCGEPMRKAPGHDVPKAGLSRARELLHARFREPVTIEDLVVASASTTKQWLIRSFRRAFRFTPHEYLTQLRVQRARELVRYGHACGEAAHAVGFYDQSHMNRHFVKYFGITPGAYAKAA